MKIATAIAALSTFRAAHGLSDHVKNNVRANFGDHKVIAIHEDHMSEDLKNLLNVHDVDHFGSDHESNLKHFKISPEAFRALESSNIAFQDSTEEWINHFETNFNDPTFFCTEETDSCANRDLQSFYSSYQTLDAIYARITSLVSGSNGLATMSSIGTSYQGRSLNTVFIADDGVKPLVFFNCNIHAREWLTPMYCTYMIETLLASGGHALTQKYAFAILPSTNPDGYVYSYTTNNMWRKTRKPNTGSSCVGTDGNRNYPVSHCGDGASTNPCSETYCGTAPFNQPETAAIRDFAVAHSGRIITTNDVHAYGQYFMSPWAYTYSQPPAADYAKMNKCMSAAVAAIKAVNGLTFAYGPVATTIYIAAGGAVDYFYQEHGVIHAYTAEVRGTSFQPAASNIMPSNQEIFAGMVATLNCITAENTPTVPTAPTVPTPAPTVGCADLVPSGLVWSDGTAAECSGFSSFYCTFYDIVRERCPATCGDCSIAVSAKSIVQTRTVQQFHAACLIAPIFGAAVAGIIAFVVVKRRNAQLSEAAADEVAKDVEVDIIAKNTEELGVPADVVPAPKGKDAPKDMFDV